MVSAFVLMAASLAMCAEAGPYTCCDCIGVKGNGDTRSSIKGVLAVGQLISRSWSTSPDLSDLSISLPFQCSHVSGPPQFLTSERQILPFLGSKENTWTSCTLATENGKEALFDTWQHLSVKSAKCGSLVPSASTKESSFAVDAVTSEVNTNNNKPVDVLARARAEVSAAQEAQREAEKEKNKAVSAAQDAQREAEEKNKAVVAAQEAQRGAEKAASAAQEAQREAEQKASEATNQKNAAVAAQKQSAGTLVPVLIAVAVLATALVTMVLGGGLFLAYRRQTPKGPLISECQLQGLA